MNPESLQALIIDRHFGELSPEVVELLDLHLAQNPASRAEAERLREALALARETVRRHPELALPEGGADPGNKVPEHRRRVPSGRWLKAAAVVFLAAVAGGGYLLTPRGGPGRPPSAVVAVAQTPEGGGPRQSPWARYQFSRDAAGAGLQVRRIEAFRSAGEGAHAP